MVDRSARLAIIVLALLGANMAAAAAAPDHLAGTLPPVTATADADARRSAARAAAWREDLDVARDEFLRRDRSYSPAARADASHRL